MANQEATSWSVVSSAPVQRSPAVGILQGCEQEILDKIIDGPYRSGLPSATDCRLRNCQEFRMGKYIWFCQRTLLAHNVLFIWL